MVIASMWHRPTAGLADWTMLCKGGASPISREKYAISGSRNRRDRGQQTWRSRQNRHNGLDQAVNEAHPHNGADWQGRGSNEIGSPANRRPADRLHDIREKIRQLREDSRRRGPAQV